VGCFSLSTRLYIYPTEMRLFSPLLLVASAVSVLAQTFEPADFNVTEALLDQGVNVSAIPGLLELAERSSTAGCAIAVSPVDPVSCSGQRRLTLASIVQFSAACLWLQPCCYAGVTSLRCVYELFLVYPSRRGRSLLHLQAIQGCRCFSGSSHLSADPVPVRSEIGRTRCFRRCL
jgi:hypothetical protein